MCLSLSACVHVPFGFSLTLSLLLSFIYIHVARSPSIRHQPNAKGGPRKRSQNRPEGIDPRPFVATTCNEKLFVRTFLRGVRIYVVDDGSRLSRGKRRDCRRETRELRGNNDGKNDDARRSVSRESIELFSRRTVTLGAPESFATRRHPRPK